MAEEKYLGQGSLALNNLRDRKTLRNLLFRELRGQLSGGERSKQVILREGHRVRPCPQSRGIGRSPAWTSSSEVTPTLSLPSRRGCEREPGGPVCLAWCQRNSVRA